MAGAAIAVITGAFTVRQLASSSRDKAYENIEIVVDASVGMRTAFHGEAKRDALKRTLAKVLSNQTAGRDKIALRQYGGECDQEGNTSLVLGFGLRNHDKIRDALSKLKLEGKAPLVAGVIKATGDFPNDPDIRKRIIVIAGDGGCDSDPAKQLGGRLLNRDDAKPIVLDFNFIYLGDSADEYKKLEAIAKATGGNSYPADTPERLEAALLRTVEVEPVLKDVKTIRKILDEVVNRANDVNTAFSREDYTAAEQELKRARDEFDRTELVLGDLRKRQNRELFQQAQELASQNRELQNRALQLLQQIIEQGKAKDAGGLEKSAKEYKTVTDNYNANSAKLDGIVQRIARGE